MGILAVLGNFTIDHEWTWTRQFKFHMFFMFSGRVNQDGFCPAGVQPRLQVPRGEDPEAAAPGESRPSDQGQL